jgi:hypothetical protein
MGTQQERAMTDFEHTLATYNRSIRDTREVTQLLQEAARTAHLVPPVMACGSIPDGFEVAFSCVVVDVERDTFSPTKGDDEGVATGQVCLKKTALDQIAAAAGVEWDSELSRVTSEELHFVRYMAVGRYKRFDNTEAEIQDQRQTDLREGSDTVAQMHAAARRNGKRDANARIQQDRVNILTSTITKARGRALKTLGIRSSYWKDELEVPFVCARLMFTGRTDDPELRRQYAMMQAEAALGSRRALYGDRKPAPRLPLEPPPPVGTPEPRDGPCCEYCGSEEGISTLRGPGGTADHCQGAKCQDLAQRNVARAQSSDGSAAPPADRPKPPPAAQSPSPGGAAGVRAPTRNGGPGVPRGSVKPLSGFTIPGGDEKGVPIEKASDGALRYWERRIDDGFRKGTIEDRYHVENEKLLAAINAEFARRQREDNVPY